MHQLNFLKQHIIIVVLYNITNRNTGYVNMINSWTTYICHSLQFWCLLPGENNMSPLIYKDDRRHTVSQVIQCLFTFNNCICHDFPFWTCSKRRGYVICSSKHQNNKTLDYFIFTNIVSRSSPNFQRIAMLTIIPSHI